MTVTKCDYCDKTVAKNFKGQTLRLGYGFFGRLELCLACSEDIKKFLEKRGLLAKSGYEDLRPRPGTV